jgi:hypothetical protein
MSSPHPRPRLVRLLAVLCAISWAFSAWLAYLHFRSTVDFAFAEGTMVVLDDLGGQAAVASVPRAADLLSSIAGYYPSGSRLDHGCRADRVLERHRAYVIAQVIARLRTETGLDLGPKPEAWIRHFAGH